MANARIESVLFCCTGNVFRSLTAEYALRRELERRGVSLAVSSAGTEDMSRAVQPYVRSYLESQGLDVSAHARRTLTRTLLDGADLVVAMSTEHCDGIWSSFQQRAPLFLELCESGQSALPDVDEAVPDYLTNRDAAQAHIRITIDRIIEAMPRLADRICRGELTR